MKYYSKETGCVAFENEMDYLNSQLESYLEYIETCDLDEYFSFHEFMVNDDAFYCDFDLINAYDYREENPGCDGSKVLRNFCDSIKVDDDNHYIIDDYVLQYDWSDDYIKKEEELCEKYNGVYDAYVAFDDDDGRSDWSYRTIKELLDSENHGNITKIALVHQTKSEYIETIKEYTLEEAMEMV